MSIVVLLLNIVVFVFIARALASWIRVGPESPLRPIIDGLFQITEPVLAPIRRVLPSMGGFDFSVLIVILVIRLLLIPLVSSV